MARAIPTINRKKSISHGPTEFQEMKTTECNEKVTEINLLRTIIFHDTFNSHRKPETFITATDIFSRQ